MLTTLFTTLLSWLGGGVVDKILDALNKRVDAQTEDQRIRSQVTIEAIKSEVAAQQAGRDLIIAEQGRWYSALPRPLFAGIFILYVGKVVVWDKVLALGTTDPLSPEMTNLMGIIVGAYFGGRTIEKIASTWASTRASRGGQ
ncbi:hypothetical protein V5G24_23520 [Xanthobacter sp. VTT E-85241]|uniref:hypothetical protein n=1 Tax=Roseixanthobacter finlandensis TaxID=3119922 RepID=UPI003728A9ED